MSSIRPSAALPGFSRFVVVLAGALLAGSCAPAATPSGPPVAAAAGADARGHALTLPRLDDRQLRHLLGRTTFGPRPGDVERLRALGAAAWLERQLEPARLDDAEAERLLAGLPTLAMPIEALQREFPRPDPALREKLQSGKMTRQDIMELYPPEKRPARIIGELQAARMVRAVASERQLEELVVDFWFNHFNVFAGKAETRWYVTAYERDVIRPHALGSFRDLVTATARHPAMLYYLDNWLSARPDFVVPGGPNVGRRGGLNENYARELMELHTLGVDGGYTQKDVTEVARAFTGWSIDRPRVEARFIFRPAMHDRGEKLVLGHRLPAGGGEDDGERVIEILTRHSSTARFIAGKLVRRFVADAPPPALVARVARVFGETDGDVRAMLRTLFSSPEFWAEDARRAKVKKPLELVASAVRAVGGSVDARGGFSLARAVAEIGEPLYLAQPPTGHPDRAQAWVSTAALLARMNFALDLVQSRYPGVRLDVASLVAGADRRRPEAVLDRLLTAILPGEATRDTRSALGPHLGDPEITRLPTDDRGPTNTGAASQPTGAASQPLDVEKLLALVLGSPEFQRR